MQVKEVEDEDDDEVEEDEEEACHAYVHELCLEGKMTKRDYSEGNGRCSRIAAHNGPLAKPGRIRGRGYMIRALIVSGVDAKSVCYPALVQLF